VQTRRKRWGSWRVLRHTRFRIYFAGSLISNLGTWVQNTAQLLIAYKITHSVFAVGLITCAQFSGFLIIGPWAGNLANLMGRKRVLISTQVLSFAVASIMAILILAARLTESELVIGALGTGLAMTFALPVQNTMVSALVPEEDTKAALTMNSVSYNGGRTLAPVLYLVLLANIGAGWAFALNALTFLVFTLIIILVYPSMTPQTKPERAWSGVHIAVRKPRILLLLAMVAAVTAADDPVLVLGPSVAHQMHASSLLPAYFLSALGLGTVLGALVPSRPTSARWTAVPLAVLAISVIAFAFAVSAWVSILAAIAAGLAGLLTGVSAQALLLEQAGPAQATQIMALWAVAWAGSKPIASIADGWLASNLGTPLTAVILGTPALTVAVLELFLARWHKRTLKKFASKYNEFRMQSPKPAPLIAGRRAIAVARHDAYAHAAERSPTPLLSEFRPARPRRCRSAAR
jgi:MFS family permease